MTWYRGLAFIYDCCANDYEADQQARVAACKEAVTRQSWYLVDTYQDYGGGPVNGLTRPEWIRMVARILGERRRTGGTRDLVVIVEDWPALAADDTTLAKMMAQLELAGAELTTLVGPETPTP